MKKNDRIVIITILAGLLIAVGVLFADFYFGQQGIERIGQTPLEALPLTGQVGQDKAEIKKEIILVIDDGRGSFYDYELPARENITAFGLLKEGAEKLGLELKTKNYEMGIFIEQIGAQNNGQDGRYWLYYVNGKMPQIAADRQLLKPGDKVEFKFQRSPF